MAHGHEDYYSGMVLYGVVSGNMVPINLDAGGNLVALLKAMYGTTPTTLACDADGNLNVNVAVALAAIGVEPKDGTTIFKVTPDGGAAIMKVAEQTPLTTIKVAPTDANPTFKVTPDGGAAIMKVAEQTPLTSIQVEPKSGMGNLKIDINAQTLGKVNTLNAFALKTETLYKAQIANTTTAAIFTMSGKFLFSRMYLFFWGCTLPDNFRLSFAMDGVNIPELFPIYEEHDFSLGNRAIPFKWLVYDTVNTWYAIDLSEDIFISTGVSLSIYNSTGAAVNYSLSLLYRTL